MLHWWHTARDILFVLPQNVVAGNLKTASCVSFTMFLVCTRLYLIEGIFASKLSADGGTEILFDEVELERVTGKHFCIWSSIVSDRSIPEMLHGVVMGEFSMLVRT